MRPKSPSDPPVKVRGKLIAVVAACRREDYSQFENIAHIVNKTHGKTDWHLSCAMLQHPTCFYFLDWIIPHAISKHQVDGVYGHGLREYYDIGYFKMAARIPGPEYKWAYETAFGFFLVCMKNQFDIDKKFAQLELNRYKRLDYLRERQRYNADKKRALKDAY